MRPVPATYTTPAKETVTSAGRFVREYSLLTMIRDSSQLPLQTEWFLPLRSPAEPPAPFLGDHEKGYLPTLLLLGSRNSREKVFPNPGTLTSTPSGNWVTRDVLL